MCFANLETSEVSIIELFWANAKSRLLFLQKISILDVGLSSTYHLTNSLMTLLLIYDCVACF